MADKKGAKTKKKPVIRNFLTSPYSLTWPKLDKGDNKSILDGIRSVFPTDGIKREKKEESPSDRRQIVSWDMTKNSLVIGVNSVTKALERDNLMLVLVCRSTKPAILSNHLMLLSATRSTPCCAVFGLSEVMAPLLGIKTVVACGFKKDVSVNILKDLVEYIVCKIPPLPEQYLTTWNNTGISQKQQLHSLYQEIPGNLENKVQCDSGTDFSKFGSINELKNEHRKEKKRSSDAMNYVETQIKTLHSREIPKIKKSKKMKKSLKNPQ